MPKAVIEEKKKIELPRALREITKILAEEGIKTYQELAEKLNKDETTIIRQCQKLIELEVCVKAEKDGKAAIALADDVEIDEEGNAWVPSPFEEPMEKLKSMLEDAGVKGRKLRWIMRLVEANPRALQQPQVLYDTLIGAGIRRRLAEQITQAFFGGNFVAPQQPPAAHSMPYMGYGYQSYSPYGYNPMMPPPWMMMRDKSTDRELMRLEMKLEKLAEKIAEKKESSAPPYPVVREIHYTEDGKQVVVEKPVWAASQSSDNKLLVNVMQELAKQREETTKMIMSMQQQFMQALQQIAESQKEIISRTQQMLLENEIKHKEEMAKLREEMVKRESELKEKMLQREIQELRQSIEGLKSYYESKIGNILEEIKREWEWKLKLKELEERRGLRDVVVEEIRNLGKEIVEGIREGRQIVKQYAEVNLKQRVQKVVPKVEREEKAKIVEALRRKVGKAAPAKAKEEPKEVKKEEKRKKREVKMQIIEKGESK